ncbi:DUF721 domain-containing protein [uncultured Thiohalocapsa sp.]|uniref:DUF721 domain-containing protein n=1 Tax=uncultured Thiohalocapsa sp. TaxID=768990 RepID=UPI0025D28D79|nr:DUF721 domain-containing protein [uncultured Thiohalocapsa sp.]
MPLRARHVCRFLQGSDAVVALLAEIERRDALLAHVRSLLPATVARHCTQATLDEGQLTLICDSPAWVDRLRFLSPQFLPALAARGRAVTACRVRVQPQVVAAPAVARAHAAGDSPRAVNPDAARVVEQYASVLGDSPLAASLCRLAATLRQAAS